MKKQLCTIFSILLIAMAGCQEAAEYDGGNAPAPNDNPTLQPDPPPSLDDPYANPDDSEKPDWWRDEWDDLDMFFLSYMFAISANPFTGFIAPTEAEMVRQIEDHTIMTIADLSLEKYEYVVQNGLTETTLLRFTMLNEEPLLFIEEGNEENDGIFVRFLTHEDEIYVIFFGATLNILNGDRTGTTFDEAEFFCQQGTYFTYYTIALPSHDRLQLLPIIAGNETDGFYAVRSALAFQGVDVSSMESPLEQAA